MEPIKASSPSRRWTIAPVDPARRAQTMRRARRPSEGCPARTDLAASYHAPTAMKAAARRRSGGRRRANSGPVLGDSVSQGGMSHKKDQFV